MNEPPRDADPSAANRSQVARVFAGSGEMARLIRDSDWSHTPLGAIAAWPESLRTAVSICLGSRHPIVLWWGPERLMFYNDAYRPMLGDSKHPQFLGRPGDECWSEIWDVIGPMMDQVLATGEATWSEDLLLLMRRSGYLEETYFTFSYSPIRDQHGEPRGVFNACAESTARVLSERRLKSLRQLTIEARSARDAAERCAAALGQNARDLPFVLIYLLEQPGRALALSGQFGLQPGTPASPLRVELAGSAPPPWPFAEVLERRAGVLSTELARRFDCLPELPWDAAPEQALLLPIARPGSQEPNGVLVLGINPRRALDDDYRGYCELAAGHVATAVASARAYEEERARAEALAEVDRAKTTFFSNVSHEFRTPLTLILGPVEDALASPERSLSGESLEAVHRSAVRLLRLVNSVLDFSRVEAGRLQLAFEATDLSLVTNGLASSFQSLLDGAGLELRVDCPPLPEPVYVDRAHWEKVVLNLISNAFKFTFEGRISVRLAWRGDHVELAVEDTGTGIPEAELGRIFERFHRVEGAKGRSFEGTGIGLSLVEELVNLHGGSLRVTSREGQGSTFTVSIPTGSAHLPAERIVPRRASDARSEAANPYFLEASHWDDRREPAAQPAQTPTGEAATQSARLLVVDDNADMRDYLVRLLGPHWHVETANNGRLALEAIRASVPDLILSDVTMPELDGLGLLQALRSEPKTRTIPIILLSARAGEDALLSGLSTGADDYLVKPFSARELLTRVRTHLAIDRMRRETEQSLHELAEARRSLVLELEQKNAALALTNHELRVTQSQLIQSAKMASLGELVGGVAHEVNNPLAFALAHLDTVERSLAEVEVGVPSALRAPWDKAGNRLREMHLGLERIRELVLKLRTFSRLDEGERKRASVSDGIKSVLMILGHRLADRIEVDSSFGEPDVIECYPGLLNQAIMNLAANAIEAIEGRGRITIASGAQGGVYTVAVRDTGSGIPKSIRDRVLEPFFTTKRDGQGTGLGLSIAYSIARRHGGELELRPAPDGGTVAELRFPLGLGE